MNLSFENIEKRFSGLCVIDNFSRDIEEGELVALVSPSVCGKSILLHIAAGLERPSAGSMLADGRPVRGPNPERTLMFQENALYPWLTLAQNVAMALELQRVGRKHARAQALAWLEKVCLKRVSKITIRAKSPAACCSVRRWRGQSFRVRRCCCSTNRSGLSTRSRA